MKYTGALKKAIVRKRLGILHTESEFQDDSQRIVDEMVSKLPELFAVYEVNQGDWVSLAFRLAQAHVPGFKVVDPPGRPPEWGPHENAGFHIDVDAVIDERHLTVVEAIKIVIRMESWAKKTSPMNMVALERRYYSADPAWVKIVKDARAYEIIVRDQFFREPVIAEPR